MKHTRNKKITTPETLIEKWISIKIIENLKQKLQQRVDIEAICFAEKGSLFAALKSN